MRLLQARRESREEGFSLIEIIVTMVMVSIIFATVVIASIQWRKTGIDRSVETDLQTNSVKVQQWKIGHPRGIPSNTNVTPVTTESDTVITIIGNADGTYAINGTNARGKEAADPEGITYNSTTQRITH